jgi:DNA-binding HxlR family transcriptional regulator
MDATGKGPSADCAQAGAGCDIGDLFRLLGKVHVLDILHMMIWEPGPRRFVDIQHKLGISPNTLSERLKSLVEAGLLSRTAYSEIPPRVDYEATKKARDLGPVFRSLREWSERNALAPAEPAATPTPPSKPASKAAPLVVAR